MNDVDFEEAFKFKLVDRTEVKLTSNNEVAIIELGFHDDRNFCFVTNAAYLTYLMSHLFLVQSKMIRDPELPEFAVKQVVLDVDAGEVVLDPFAGAALKLQVAGGIDVLIPVNPEFAVQLAESSNAIVEHYAQEANSSGRRH